jgi:hypothetical protein
MRSIPSRLPPIANIILTPDIFERERLIVTRSRYLTIEGKLQNQDGVVHVKAQRIVPFNIAGARSIPQLSLSPNYHHSLMRSE